MGTIMELVNIIYFKERVDAEHIENVGSSRASGSYTITN
jgi:hypothetical protein